jgi:hypothetical protein
MPRQIITSSVITRREIFYLAQRAHCLPHRQAPAHRRGGRPAAQATHAETIMRMIRHTSTARTTGFFRLHARSHVAPCPRGVKTMQFAAPRGLKGSCWSCVAGKSISNPIGRSSQIADNRASQPLPTAALRTQNAYGVARLCRYK